MQIGEDVEFHDGVILPDGVRMSGTSESQLQITARSVRLDGSVRDSDKPRFARMRSCNYISKYDIKCSGKAAWRKCPTATCQKPISKNLASFATKLAAISTSAEEGGKQPRLAEQAPTR